MANGVNPNILLQFGRGQSPVGPAIQNFLNIRQQRKLQEQQDLIAPLRQQLLESQVAQAQQGVQAGQQKLQSAEFNANIRDLAFSGSQLKGFLDRGDIQGAQSFLSSQMQGANPQKQQAIAEAQQLLNSGRPEDIDLLSARSAQLERLGQRFGGIAGAQSNAVQSSQILGDGTTVQLLRSGETRVTDPTGRVVTGEERVGVLKRAREQEAQQQAERAGQRAQATADVQLTTQPKIKSGVKAAEAAIKQSSKAFERLEPINTAIANIDEAIGLIDQGAKTGVIASKLPSISKSSIQLDNLQKRLGLDVVSNTTFGALSENELKFALDSALPKNLKPQDLKRWLQRKRQSQEKLSNYLSEVATFLGTPGNTVADFIQLQKAQQLEQEAQQSGGVQIMRFDAEGNLIQ